ncbi:MAG: hypothetical protein WCR70_03805 [Sphaerochaetaceae bacterium]
MGEEKTLRALKDLVKRMREAQKEYFRDRKGSDLEKSKRLEREVDKMLEEIEQGQGEEMSERDNTVMDAMAVGESVTLTCVAVDKLTCTGCYFVGLVECELLPRRFRCSAVQRKDGKDVIFVAKKEGNE